MEGFTTFLFVCDINVYTSVMDQDIVGDEVDKTTDVVKKNNACSVIRKRQLQKLEKPNGCGNTMRKNMRVNSGMHFSTYVGTPYHKLKVRMSQVCYERMKQFAYRPRKCKYFISIILFR